MDYSNDSIKNFFPFSRFFARCIDLLLYSKIASLIFKFIDLSNNTIVNEVLKAIIIILLLFLVEPIFLSLFGTTVGKALLSIRVTDKSGNLLTYKKAFKRVFFVFVYGLGLYLHLFIVVRLIFSYFNYRNNIELPWEKDSKICFNSGFKVKNDISSEVYKKTIDDNEKNDKNKKGGKYFSNFICKLIIILGVMSIVYLVFIILGMILLFYGLWEVMNTF